MPCALQIRFYYIHSMENLHICLLGCGDITKPHAKQLSKIAGVDISFASRSLEKAQSYQSSLKGVSAFGSYEEAILDTSVNAVMINTPPHVHYDLAHQALTAGKHVVVEKPPFFKSSDFDSLGALADQKGLQLLVAENYFYRPLRYKIAELLQSNVIGQPLFMSINATKTQDNGGDWREDQAITGFGALFEGGIHWLNFINNLGFDIVRIEGFQPKKSDILERSMQVVAETSQGLIINLLYSWEVDTMWKGARISKIHGTGGSIGFESNGVFVWIRGERKRFFLPGLREISGSAPMFRDFIDAMKSGRPAEYTWRMAQSDLELVEKSYSSAQNSLS